MHPFHANESETLVLSKHLIIQPHSHPAPLAACSKRDLILLAQGSARPRFRLWRAPMGSQK